MNLSLSIFSLIAVTSISGCFEPIQGGGVVIIGDPGERIAALCRFRHRAADPLCAPDAEEPAQVEGSEPQSLPRSEPQSLPRSEPQSLPRSEPQSLPR